MTATDPLALEGRDERPLTAVTPIDLEPSGFLLEEVAKHIAEAISGVIVAGRQLDPELREPLAHLAEAAGFPILAEPTSQMRCGPARPLARDRRLRPAARATSTSATGRPPTWSCASARCRPASRCAPGSPAPAPTRSSSTRAAAGTSRPGGRRRSCAPTRPSSPPAGRRGSSAATASTPSSGWRADDAAAARRSRPSSTRRRADHRAGRCTWRSAPRIATATSSTPPRACRSATRRPSCPPRRRRRPLPLQPRRQRDRRPGLLGDRRRRRERPADDDRHRRPRPPPRPRRPRRPARRRHAGAHRRHRQRRRRHLPLPAAGGGARRRGVRGPARHPARRQRRAGRRSSSASPTGALDSLAELPEALAAGTGLIEVAVEREANVAVHRALADAVGAAIA